MLLKYFPKINTRKSISWKYKLILRELRLFYAFLPFVTGMILYPMNLPVSKWRMPHCLSFAITSLLPSYLAQFQIPIHAVLEEFLLLVLLTKSHYGALWNNPKYSDIMRENRCTENEKNSLCTLLVFFFHSMSLIH